MHNENKINQPVLLIGITIIIIYFISFIHIGNDVNILGIQLRDVDILSDLKESPADEDYYYEQEYYQEQDDSTEGEVLNIDNTHPYQNINTASFMLIDKINEAFASFISSEINKIKNDPSSMQLSFSRKIEGNTDQLKYFFNALKNINNTKVRIAHYGDSQIEGDYVTCALRDKLQKKFGGQGVGYLAITSQDKTFRITIDHRYPEDDWETGSIFMGNRRDLPVGIGGEVFIPKKSTWISYETRGYFTSIKRFNAARIFYSDAKTSSINYSFNSGISNSAQLIPGSSVKELLLDANGSASSLKITFSTSDQAYFYGVSLENGNGIYVDNIPFRGDTGEDLQKIPFDKLQDFNRLLNYKLIILQFGKNAVGTNFIRYEKEMAQAIEHLKKAFPNTSFLMISVQDTGFKTDSRTTGLLSTQIKISKATDIAFWNLFEAMGGKNSMANWVKSNPPLASADHTHFNNEGAKKVGEMIAQALLDAYYNNK